MTGDRGLAALAEAFEIHGYPEGWIPGAFALAILGDRAVFWPTGTDEYRELIRQYQAEIARLRNGIEMIVVVAADSRPLNNSTIVVVRVSEAARVVLREAGSAPDLAAIELAALAAEGGPT